MGKIKDLKELRKEIDIVDTKLIELLKERFEITRQIGEYKEATGSALFAPEREVEKIRDLNEKLSGYDNAEYIEDSLISLMNCSKSQQSNNTYGKKDIYLIGMPGCGKTTVGKILAEKMQRALFDTDKLFTYVYGMSPALCIENSGEIEFRRLETVLLKNIARRQDLFDESDSRNNKNNVKSRIISCGGGIVVKDENKAVLKKDSIVVYIKRDLGKLAKNGRPLSLKVGVEALYEQRKSKYESWSDFVIDNNNNVEDSINEFLEYLKNLKNT